MRGKEMADRSCRLGGGRGAEKVKKLGGGSKVELK